MPSPVAVTMKRSPMTTLYSWVPPVLDTAEDEALPTRSVRSEHGRSHVRPEVGHDARPSSPVAPPESVISSVAEWPAPSPYGLGFGAP